MGSCRDVINILSRMPCEGLDSQQKQSILQMKEIAFGVVNKCPKVAATEHFEPGEMVFDVLDANSSSFTDCADFYFKCFFKYHRLKELVQK